MTTKVSLVASLRALGVEITDSRAKKTALATLEQMLAAEQARRNVASITARRSAGAMNRPPKPAAAFRPTAPGSKRALMAELVLRPEGATVEDLVRVTGWNRSTAQGGISEDLVRQMGLGMRRDGDRYFGSLPEGIASAVRDAAPVRMAANSAPRTRK